MEDNDADSFSRWRQGDMDAGRRFVRRHMPAIARFFVSKVGTEHDADDLTAKTFEILLAKREEFRGDASPRTFLFAIAHQVLLGWFRDRQRADERFDPATHSVASLGPSPSSLLHAARRDRIVIEALRTIPLQAQEILELTYFEELSRAEVAAVTSLPEGTVASRLRRARELLQAELLRVGSHGDLEHQLAALRSWLTPGAGP